MNDTAIGIIGLIFVALALLQTARIHRQSIDAQMFLELTFRLNSLSSFNALINQKKINQSYDKATSTDTAIFSYLDLLSQEFYLHQNKLLSNRVWRLWQPDIQLVVKSTLVSEAWTESAKARYSHHKDFCSYIDSIIHS